MNRSRIAALLLCMISLPSLAQSRQVAPTEVRRGSAASIGTDYSAYGGERIAHAYGSYVWTVTSSGSNLRLESVITLASESTECASRHALAHEARHHAVASRAFLSSRGSDVRQVMADVGMAMRAANPEIDNGADQQRMAAECGNMTDHAIRTQSFYR